MEPEGSLQHLQVPATCPCPCPCTEIHKSNPCPPSHFLKIHLKIVIPRLGLQNGLFSSDFLTKNLYARLLFPIHATYPVHLVLLDLITRIEFSDD